jgi:hypothetical protein
MSSKEASDALVSRLQQQLQVAAAEGTSASATSTATKLEQQILGVPLGDAANGTYHHSASFGASLSDSDSALAGLWGGGSSITGSRVWGGADGDKQLREMKNRVQVLQMELVDARLQVERCVENEGRLNAQLQRVLSENDTALVMLGQVYTTSRAILFFVTRLCSERRKLKYCGRSLKMSRLHFESSCCRS